MRSQKKIFMKKSFLIIGVVLSLPVLVSAQVQVEDGYKKKMTFDSRHQAGVRLGIWHNQGDEPLARDD